MIKNFPKLLLLVFVLISACNSGGDVSDTESMILEGIEWVRSTRPNPQEMLQFAGDPLYKEDFGANQEWYYILSMSYEDENRGFVVSFKDGEFNQVKPITGD